MRVNCYDFSFPDTRNSVCHTYSNFWLYKKDLKRKILLGEKKKHLFLLHTERPAAPRDCRVWRTKYTFHQVASGGTTPDGYQASSQNCEKLLLASGTAVAEWLRCCATIRKVTVSIPSGVSGFFQ